MILHPSSVDPLGARLDFRFARELAQEAVIRDELGFFPEAQEPDAMGDLPGCAKTVPVY